MDDQKSNLSQYIDRSRFTELIPSFLLLFKSTDNVAKLQLVSKCLAYLTKLPSDKAARLTLIQEENLRILFDYIKKYQFDESIIIVLLDILDHLMEDMNNRLSDILYSEKWNLISIFQYYLAPSKILGTYHSQSVNYSKN